MTPEDSPPQTVVDPVCGMEVDPADAAGHVEHRGRDYYFCSPHCVEAFSADPEKFVSSDGAAAAAPVTDSPAQPGAQYTCPMHPEVVRNGPGACPKCGMALEPALPALATEYTCPMHPEIVRDRPGSCPICGWRWSRARRVRWRRPIPN